MGGVYSPSESFRLVPISGFCVSSCACLLAMGRHFVTLFGFLFQLAEKGMLRSVAATSDEPGTVTGAGEASRREGGVADGGEGMEEAENSDDEW